MAMMEGVSDTTSPGEADARIKNQPPTTTGPDPIDYTGVCLTCSLLPAPVNFVRPTMIVTALSPSQTTNRPPRFVYRIVLPFYRSHMCTEKKRFSPCPEETPAPVVGMRYSPRGAAGDLFEDGPELGCSALGGAVGEVENCLTGSANRTGSARSGEGTGGPATYTPRRSPP